MKLSTASSAAREVRVHGAADPEPAAFFDTALRQHAGAARILVVAVPAPAVPLASAWGLSEGSAALWEPADGPCLLGWGEAHVVRPVGEAPGVHVRRAVQGVAASLLAVHHPAVPALRPRWLGGLAFAPGAASREPWAEFGDGRFVLPRWCYGRWEDRAWLTFAVDASALEESQRSAASGELRALLAALARIGRSEDGAVASAREAHTVSHPPREQWDAQVRTIGDAIARGEVAKVVVARCSTVEASADIDPGRLLARLGAAYPGCTRFAVRSGEATFVGATPERLVAREGRRVVSEAMAGSVPHGASAALLESEKDRREHDLVVDAIVERLSPHCTALERSAEPQVRELPNVVHLQTPVTGVLRELVHVLDLLDLLHPTPAVGGVPVDDAVRWIVAREPVPRGWYSGPVGWFDAAGDGEFAVALRSGLVRGRRAHVYAGAGIVRGSVPAAEYAETALKLRPLLDALGVRGADQEG
jgi:salicylate biosynthesis isochorismate synthase